MHPKAGINQNTMLLIIREHTDWRLLNHKAIKERAASFYIMHYLHLSRDEDERHGV